MILLFIINEFNLEDIIDKESINIKGYQLETDDLIKYGMARTAIYIKNNINYTRMKKYDVQGDSE